MISPWKHHFYYSGLVPLHNACSYGHYEVTELLLRVCINNIPLSVILHHNNSMELMSTPQICGSSLHYMKQLPRENTRCVNCY